MRPPPLPLNPGRNSLVISVRAKAGAELRGAAATSEEEVKTLDKIGNPKNRNATTFHN